MTITVAVTGGIGAGKSTVSGLLAARGAVVVDSDRLAREVVAVGTPGLAAVADEFGDVVLAADGSLDRAALAAIVFADAAARRRLEGITHPLVRARFADLQGMAPAGSVVVNDIPLLTTRAAAAAFHLVIGVGAAEDIRVGRLVERGLSAADAKARIAAQIGDDARRPLCDVWIDNGGPPADARRRADLLFSRLRGYAANVEAGRGAPRGPLATVPPDPDWPAVARRLSDRVRHVVGDCRVDHIGATAVPGLATRDVIDLQVTVADADQADRLAPALAAAGFPRPAQLTVDPAGARLRHVNADPGRPTNVHLALADAPDWGRSLRYRDWLRADAEARAEYPAAGVGAGEAGDGSAGITEYPPAAQDWLSTMDDRVRRWALATGWTPAPA